MQSASGFDDCLTDKAVLNGIGHSERGGLSLSAKENPRLTPRALSSGGFEVAPVLSNTGSRPSSTALPEGALQPLIESPPTRGCPSLPFSLSWYRGPSPSTPGLESGSSKGRGVEPQTSRLAVGAPSSRETDTMGVDRVAKPCRPRSPRRRLLSRQGQAIGLRGSPYPVEVTKPEEK